MSTDKGKTPFVCDTEASCSLADSAFSLSCEVYVGGLDAAAELVAKSATAAAYKSSKSSMAFGISTAAAAGSGGGCGGGEGGTSWGVSFSF